MSKDIQNITSIISKIILGKDQQIKLSLACLLAKGHLLIEDVPGVGKTTLALSLAKVLGMEFQRIQFTNDLLPSDILGVSIYEAKTSNFVFHEGPIFAQLVLADEINRASPKTQSALLEAMEEGQVTVEGESKTLPQPFFVVATQNPSKQIGTFPLPESQMDRFLMRISMGYPDDEAEMSLLTGKGGKDILNELSPAIAPGKLILLQKEIGNIHTSAPLLHYIMALAKATRKHPSVKIGLSPRAVLAIKKCSQAWAFIDGRDSVLPEDVQAIFMAVAEHRLATSHHAHDIVTSIITQTVIP